MAPLPVTARTVGARAAALTIISLRRHGGRLTLRELVEGRQLTEAEARAHVATVYGPKAHLLGLEYILPAVAQ
jgi:hypothetical protein